MFTPQMSPEYSPMHFPALVCQRHNEVCAPLKCDLHDSSRLRTPHPHPHQTEIWSVWFWRNRLGPTASAACLQIKCTPDMSVLLTLFIIVWLDFMVRIMICVKENFRPWLLNKKTIKGNWLSVKTALPLLTRLRQLHLCPWGHSGRLV